MLIIPCGGGTMVHGIVIYGLFLLLLCLLCLVVHGIVIVVCHTLFYVFCVGVCSAGAGNV